MQAPNIIAQVLERMMPVGSIVEWAPVDSGDTDLSTPAKVAAYYGFGTWEAYGSGQMLLGVSSSHAIGSTGGEECDTGIATNSKPCTLRATRLFGVWRAESGRIAWHRRGQRQSLYSARRRQLGIRILRPDRPSWRRPVPQQSDAIPRGVHLAADCVTPGRGCAA